MKSTYKIICAYCNQESYGRRKITKFCSVKCRDEHSRVYRNIVNQGVAIKDGPITRRDMVLVLASYFNRFPTLVEVNYTQITSKIKKFTDFTEEEKALYAPDRYKLKKAWHMAIKFLYVYYIQEKIRKTIEYRSGIEKRQQERAERSKAKVEIAKKKAHSLGFKPYDISELNNTQVETFNFKRNKSMIKNVLAYHARTDIPIPEEMWGVINKYK